MLERYCCYAGACLPILFDAACHARSVLPRRFDAAIIFCSFFHGVMLPQRGTCASQDRARMLPPTPTMPRAPPRDAPLYICC